MSEKTYRASNGYEIRSNFGYFDDHEECYEVRDNEAYLLKRLGQGSLQALREFFQHERDRRLGRVRWPVNPDYVIYRDESEDDEDGRCLLILDERAALSWRVWENGQSCVPLTYNHRAAADWFFTEGPGKPERPWEQAEPGEVWRLTFEGEEGTFLVKETVAGTPYFFGQIDDIDADHTSITAGRKLANADGSLADE